jgi:hypothetical protein
MARRGRDRAVVGYTIIYAIRDFSGEVYSYNIMW